MREDVSPDVHVTSNVELRNNVRLLLDVELRNYVISRQIVERRVTSDCYLNIVVSSLTRNTQTVIGHTNLCNKYGGPWTLAILALPDNLTFDLTHLIRMHIDGKI